ncbi:MAG: hypothetical protein WKF82_03055 [Nocardioidaceae bacterium]
MARPAAGFESGRLRDRTTQQFATDYSNTLGQSLGVLGLARTGGVPQRAVGYLAKQQCRAGYLRLTEVAGETCQQSGSPADVDATAVGDPGSGGCPSVRGAHPQQRPAPGHQLAARRPAQARRVRRWRDDR